MRKKSILLSILLTSYTFFYVCAYDINEDLVLTRDEYLFAEKTQNLFTVLLEMTDICDECLAYWISQQKNPNVYMINKGFFTLWGKQKKNVQDEMTQNIAWLEEKKNTYIGLLGKLYSVAHPYIEKDCFLIKRNISIRADISDVIAQIISNGSISSFYKKEVSDLEYLRPPSHFKKYAFHYGVGSALITLGAFLLYKNKNFLQTCAVTFYKNNLENPLKSLQIYSKGENNNIDPFAHMGDVSEKDIEAQRIALLRKFKTFIKEVRPGENQEVLDGILEHARSECMEKVVVDLVAQSDLSNIRLEKRGWFEWLFGGCLHNFLGMPPKAKLLEVEIKGLISRLHATKMLLDAKNLMEDNRLLLILVTLVPTILTTYFSFNIAKKIRAWISGDSQKEQQLKYYISQINEVVNKNIGKDTLSCEDQGLLCYYAHKLCSLSSIVPVSLQNSLEILALSLRSCSNSIDQKMQILQSLYFSLYSS